MNKNLNFLSKLIRIFPKISIVIGIVSIIWGFFDLSLPAGEIRRTLFLRTVFVSEISYVYFFISITLVGLLLGITSLKLKMKKTISILGIIFSALALLIWLFIWFWIIGWSYY